ncbi:MAG: hypothetical protein ACR2H3_05415 [Acidimicrobiales bacterium]
MAPSSTALVLIGFQNDFFAPDGALYGDITDVGAPERVLAATVGLIDRLAATETLIVATPIVFMPTYAELLRPVGILAAIKARGAFQVGTDGRAHGREPEAVRFKDRRDRRPPGLRRLFEHGAG